MDAPDSGGTGAWIKAEREVIARINRYSTLRAAERAVYPTVRQRRENPSASLGADLLPELREKLDWARERAEDLPSALALADGQLDALRKALTRAIDTIPMAQFRTTLPALARESKAELGGLLDFCIDEEESLLSKRLPLVDYVVTLLASESDGGVRSLSRDPVGVSATLERLCDRRAEVRDENCEAARRAFFDAANRVAEQSDLVDLVRRMRERKHELGEKFLAPEVLRSVVAYNLAVANRLAAERQRDAADRQTLEHLRSLDGASAERAATS